jgi:hypothetical protein
MDMPDEHVGLMVQLLRTLTLGESDFTLLSSEILSEIVSSETEAREVLMTSGLKIAFHVLQNVDRVFLFFSLIYKSCSENPSLAGIYEECVLPNLEIEGHAELTGHALKCLGLFCLIDRPIAEKSFEKLLHFAEFEDRNLEASALEVFPLTLIRIDSL